MRKVGHGGERKQHEKTGKKNRENKDGNSCHYAVDLQRLTAMPRLMPKRSRETGIAKSVSV